MGLVTTLSINDTQHRHYVIMSVIMLSVVMLSVVMLSICMLSVVILSVVVPFFSGEFIDKEGKNGRKYEHIVKSNGWMKRQSFDAKKTTDIQKTRRTIKRKNVTFHA